MGLGGRDPLSVHVGGCHMAGKRSRGVDRDQALRAVTEGVAPAPTADPTPSSGCSSSRTRAQSTRCVDYRSRR
ncbi:DUF6233 domain-containing protein [Streptomyces sp. NPDC056713]|uniref:DUF6233 domain-containing protein n=1 Tax=Streptomyces sp. NPDC056713 TaxID=3345921 RepID=UPI0036C9D669